MEDSIAATQIYPDELNADEPNAEPVEALSIPATQTQLYPDEPPEPHEDCAAQPELGDGQSELSQETEAAPDEMSPTATWAEAESPDAKAESTRVDKAVQVGEDVVTEHPSTQPLPSAPSRSRRFSTAASQTDGSLCADAAPGISPTKRLEKVWSYSGCVVGFLGDLVMDGWFVDLLRSLHPELDGVPWSLAITVLGFTTADSSFLTAPKHAALGRLATAGGWYLAAVELHSNNSSLIFLNHQL
eukprot:Skav233464  [mRNA]  locus=scaffold1080:227967:230225:- [translate_table: standard]